MSRPRSTDPSSRGTIGSGNQRGLVLDGRQPHRRIVDNTNSTTNSRRKGVLTLSAVASQSHIRSDLEQPPPPLSHLQRKSPSGSSLESRPPALYDTSVSSGATLEGDMSMISDGAGSSSHHQRSKSSGVTAATSASTATATTVRSSRLAHANAYGVVVSTSSSLSSGATTGLLQPQPSPAVAVAAHQQQYFYGHRNRNSSPITTAPLPAPILEERATTSYYATTQRNSPSPVDEEQGHHAALYAHSEPGVGGGGHSIYHDRFAAYLNRFAALDGGRGAAASTTTPTRRRLSSQSAEKTALSSILRSSTRHDDAALHPRSASVAFEYDNVRDEKKYDDLTLDTRHFENSEAGSADPTIPRSPSSLTERVRLRTLANRKRAAPRPQPVPAATAATGNTVEAGMEDHLDTLRDYQYRQNRHPEAQPDRSNHYEPTHDTILSSQNVAALGGLGGLPSTAMYDPYTGPVWDTASDISSNRTRDLARRYEQCMANRARLGVAAATSTSATNSSSHATTTTSHPAAPVVRPPAPQHRFYDGNVVPTKYATIIVQEGYENRFEQGTLMEASTSEQAGQYSHAHQHARHPPDGSSSTPNLRITSLASSLPIIAEANQGDHYARRNAPATSLDDDMPLETHPSNSRASRPLPSQSSTDHTSTSNRHHRKSRAASPLGHRDDHERDQQVSPTNHNGNNRKERERSKSLPPTRRSHTSPTAASSAHVDRNVASSMRVAPPRTELLELVPAPPTPFQRAESSIRRVGRAEIETPSPAKVEELRKLLWTEDEHLQVNGRMSLRDATDRLLESKNIRTTRPAPPVERKVRNARSLSPGMARRSGADSEIDDSGINPDNNTAALTPREQKGLLFKSRYYEAARRELGGSSASSPNRPTNDSKATTSAMPVDKSHLESTATKSSPGQTKDSRPRPTPSPASLPSSKLAAKEDATTRSTTPASHRSVLATTSAAAEVEPQLQQPAPIVTSSKSQETMESLLLKLAKVNRDDPNAALAQIDAILKQGTLNSAGADGLGASTEETVERGADGKLVDNTTKNVDDAEAEADDDDESTSDETSVSSITNPTYQEAKLNSPETLAASGRPRPNNLTAYSNTKPSTQANPQTVPTKGQVAEKDAKKGTKVPPSSIRVSNKKDMESSVSELVADFQAQTQEQMRDVESRTATPPVDQESKSTGMTFLQKLGTMISMSPTEVSPTKAASLVEEKIKRWDDMSTGVIPHVDSSGTRSTRKNDGSHPEDILSTGTTTDLGSIVTEKRDLSPGALRRAHPWDSAIPVRMGQVKVRDTSMESGDGVETLYTPKYPKANPSPDRSDVLPVRRMRKDRIAREAENIRKGGSRPVTTVGDDFDVNPKLAKIDKESGPIYSRHHQSQALSDAFDSAWVNLPSSNYFDGGRSSSSLLRSSAAQRRRSRSREKQQEALARTAVSATSPTVAPVARNNNVSSRALGPQHTLERSLDRQASSTSHSADRRLDRQASSTSQPKDEKEIPRTSSRPYAPLESNDRGNYAQHQRVLQDTAPLNNGSLGDINGSFETARANNSKSRSRGLRGFLKRKQAAALAGKLSASVDQATLVSASSTWRSNGSTGREVRTTASTTAYERSGSVERNRHSNRSSDVSPARSRARSLDERRIRNPSIARKYSRLMRVYDNDLTADQPSTNR